MKLVNLTHYSFSIPPKNISFLSDFLFSGDIEKQHRAAMG